MLRRHEALQFLEPIQDRHRASASATSTDDTDGLLTIQGNTISKASFDGVNVGASAAVTVSGNTVTNITDGDGIAVDDCFVVVFAQDPARWTVQTRYLAVSRPGAGGRYRVRLLPGDYYAVAMNDVEPGAWTNPEFLSMARERATKLPIRDGETKTLDLPLTSAPIF